jgi:hypothetical protein
VLNSQTSDTRLRTDDVKRTLYSAEVQPLLQSLLATLADLDFDFDRERERVSSSTKDPKLRDSLLRKLGERHRERREPYVRHLALLQARTMPPRHG